jgi:hypothetical protein
MTNLGQVLIGTAIAFALAGLPDLAVAVACLFASIIESAAFWSAGTSSETNDG